MSDQSNNATETPPLIDILGESIQKNIWVLLCSSPHTSDLLYICIYCFKHILGPKRHDRLGDARRLFFWHHDAKRHNEKCRFDHSKHPECHQELTSAIHSTRYSSIKLLKYWSRNSNPGPKKTKSWRCISLLVMWATCRQREALATQRNSVSC